MLVLIDFLPAPVPTVKLATPAIYGAIPPGDGAVLELPMGLRDGFGVIGAFDERTLLHQMTHGHPLVGGFVARLPESVKRRYSEQPLLRSLLAMSAAMPPTPEDGALTPQQAARILREAGVRYVVLHRGAASPQLAAYATSLRLRSIQSADDRELLAVGE